MNRVSSLLFVFMMMVGLPLIAQAGSPSAPDSVASRPKVREFVTGMCSSSASERQRAVQNLLSVVLPDLRSDKQDYYEEFLDEAVKETDERQKMIYASFYHAVDPPTLDQLHQIAQTLTLSMPIRTTAIMLIAMNADAASKPMLLKLQVEDRDAMVRDGAKQSIKLIDETNAMNSVVKQAR